MKGYKAFKKGLICSPNGNTKQYAENTVFEEDKVDVCHSGMHFCKNPMDCLNYYDLVDDNGEVSDFCEVEAIGDIETYDNEKFCTNKLKIGAKIDLMGFVKASVNYIRETVSCENKAGDDAQLAAGDDAQLAAGNRAKLAAGNWSQLAAGNWAQLAAGNDAKLAAGDGAKLAAGNLAKLAAGKYSNIVSGHFSEITAKENSVIVCGNDSKARAEKGSLIVLFERDCDGNIVSFKAEVVDGKKIKENTFYKLVNGEFAEVENE